MTKRQMTKRQSYRLLQLKETLEQVRRAIHPDVREALDVYREISQEPHDWESEWDAEARALQSAIAKAKRPGMREGIWGPRGRG